MKTDTLRNWLEQGGHHESDLPLVFSDCIKAHQTQLIESFRAGTPAAELIRRRSDFTDEILTIAWQRFLSADTGPLALVGGTIILGAVIFRARR